MHTQEQEAYLQETFRSRKWTHGKRCDLDAEKGRFKGVVGRKFDVVWRAFSIILQSFC